MTDDAIVDPAVEGPKGGAEPIVDTPTPVPAPSPPPPDSAKPDYARQRMKERIDRLTAEKAERDAEILRLKAGVGASQVEVEAQIESRAALRAKELAAQQMTWEKFTNESNAAVAKGKEEFGVEKFEKSRVALTALHDPKDEVNHTQYMTMVRAMLDTGEAHKVIQALGEDPNEAARIMGLSPTKMGVEIGKIASREVPAEPSGTPKPITPISGTSRSHVAIAPSDPERSGQLSTRAWMERRQAEVDALNKRAGRRML